MHSLVTSLDQYRMGIFNAWYCTGKFLGLLRTRLGRLVVLGSGRKRFIYALVGGVRVDSSVVSDKGLKLDAGTYVVQVGKRKFARVKLS